MSFQHRIQAARRHARLTQQQLADMAGLSQSQIHKLESGQSQSCRRVVHLALACGVSPLWLETGKGPMIPGMDPVPPLPLTPEVLDMNWRTAPAIHSVPLLTWEEACHAYRVDAARRIHAPLKVTPGAFALQMVGDSMAPEFCPGDMILVDPNRQPRPGCFVLMRDHAMISALLRRMGSLDEQGHFPLEPINLRYPTHRVQNTAPICGVVVAKFRDYC